MEALKQSNAEIFRIAKDWEELYAPENLIRDARTASLLVEWVLANEGIVSFTGFNHAVAALASQVLTPEPTPAEIEIDKANKLEAKMRADVKESRKPQSVVTRHDFSAQRAAIVTKEAQVKELRGLVSQIEREISSYTRGHVSGVMDYAATEYGQQDLRAVRDQHHRSTIANAKACLDAVRLAKSKMS